MHANKFVTSTGNRPIPLTCSVVEQMMPDFVTFAACKNVKIRFKQGEKDKMLLKQVQRFI